MFYLACKLPDILRQPVELNFISFDADLRRQRQLGESTDRSFAARKAHHSDSAHFVFCLTFTFRFPLFIGLYRCRNAASIDMVLDVTIETIGNGELVFHPPFHRIQ